MNAPTQADFLRRIVELLTDSGTAHMLVGSLASALHGVPRATQDVDIVIAPSIRSLDAFLAMLPDDAYYFDADEARQALGERAQFNVLDFQTGYKADLIIRKDRAFSVSEFERRVVASVHGVKLDVASAEDTIIAKLEWASVSESERQIADVAGVYGVGRQSLDLAYIARWTNELGLASLWEKARLLAEAD